MTSLLSSTHRTVFAWPTALPLLVMFAGTAQGDTQKSILSFDHFVTHVSTIPVIEGQPVQLFVRERVHPGLVRSGASHSGKVVLFIHGASLPSEAVFDPAFSDDYSILASLAQRGFDAFAMDLTTIGASTRPLLMADKCNVPVASWPLIGPVSCDGVSMPYPYMVRNANSDLDDIDAVVDYLREFRGVDRIHMVGYSDGGRAAGQYAIHHPEKIDRLVLVATSYGRTSPGLPPAALPQPVRTDPSGRPLPTAGSVQVTSKARFITDWNNQIASDDQVGPGVQDAVWQAIQATDPDGATWGDGVFRWTVVSWWGWAQSTVASVRAPTLLITGTLDGLYPNAVNLFADMAVDNRVFLSVEGTSHLIFFEKQRQVVVQAVHQWLLAGRLHGIACGTAVAAPDGRIRHAALCNAGSEP